MDASPLRRDPRSSGKSSCGSERAMSQDHNQQFVDDPSREPLLLAHPTGDTPSTKNVVSSSRRSKMDTILKRRFKRNDDDEKPLVEKKDEEDLVTPLPHAAPQHDLSAAQVEVVENNFSQKSAGRVTPDQKQKLSVSRLGKINNRSKDCGEGAQPLIDNSSTSSTPLLLPSSVQEEHASLDPSPLSKPLDPSHSKVIQSGSASSVASSLAKQSANTPRRRTRRHELVMQRLSSRKEGVDGTRRGGAASGNASKSSRSCSPTAARMLDKESGDGDAPSVTKSRSSSLGRPGAYNIQPSHANAKDVSPGPSKTAAVVSELPPEPRQVASTKPAGRQSPAIRATPPRVYRRPTPSPVPDARKSGLSRPPPLDSDGEEEPKGLDFRPVTGSCNSNDRASSPLDRSQFHRIIHARTRSLASNKKLAVPGFTNNPQNLVASTSSSNPSTSNSQRTVYRSLSSTSDDRAAESDAEMDFISHSPQRGSSRSLPSPTDSESSNSNRRMKSSAVLDQLGIAPDPCDSVGLNKRTNERVDSPSEVRSAVSPWDIRSACSPSEIRSASSADYSAKTDSLNHMDDPHGCTGTIEIDHVDTTWDSNHVYFGSFSQEMQKIQRSEGVNMFDTESWVRTEVSFQSVGPRFPVGDVRKLNVGERSIDEETKEMNGHGFQVAGVTTTFDDSHDLEPANDGHVATRNDKDVGALRKLKELEKRVSSMTEKDVDAFQTLGDLERRVSCMTPSKDLECEEANATVARLPIEHTSLLHVYTTEFATNEEVKSEISRSEAGLTDILGDYDVSVLSRPKPQVSTTVEPTSGDDTDETMPNSSITSGFPPPPTSTEEIGREKAAHVGHWTPGSPPPPPPPGTPRDKRMNRRTPQRHQMYSPGARVSGTPVATPRASGSKKAHFFGEDFSPRSEFNDAVRAFHESEPNSSHHSSNETRGEPEEAARSLSRKVLSNRNMTAVSSTVIIQDAKLAEKVDLAISAAACKFEEFAEQVDKAGSNESIHVVSHDEANGGAFSTWKVVTTSDQDEGHSQNEEGPQSDSPVSFDGVVCESAGTTKPTMETKTDIALQGKRAVCPLEHPAPFEVAIDRAPQILSSVLSFLGDPVAVCRVKMTSKACFQYVDENEHRLMRNAVRLGGMPMNVRPSFWLWVTLEKTAHLSVGSNPATTRFCPEGDTHGLENLVRTGREGKWHHVIERDVARAFGNLPPHKTGARLRADSIVRALVTWGRNRVMKRGLRGSGLPPPPSGGNSIDSEEMSLAPTDTVSDWGGVTPAGSFTSSLSGGEARNSKTSAKHRHTRRRSTKSSNGELALSGNALTEEMKSSLQDKLSFILHALSSAHTDVGYCQGMDYVVAHLLRILQDTVRWNAATGRLPSVIGSAPEKFFGPNMSPEQRLEVYAEIDRSLVVEEACFRVMDSFFTVYNLRHFYWPELRCLKTCCLVFEKLIKIKLPVLADHFEHHELNVGLFALGWFQTLFLYLPSMPSATVCHMWDIWMVERSFKIFFRVGTAILFLSQPILLNHELEGMMSYLNTFPDATLLSPDILIACALQIKVTNRLLMELERDVASSAA